MTNKHPAFEAEEEVIQELKDADPNDWTPVDRYGVWEWAVRLTAQRMRTKWEMETLDWENQSGVVQCFDCGWSEDIPPSEDGEQMADNHAAEEGCDTIGVYTSPSYSSK